MARITDFHHFSDCYNDIPDREEKVWHTLSHLPFFYLVAAFREFIDEKARVLRRLKPPKISTHM